MPFSTDADSLKHHHRAHGKLGKKWRSIANALLAEGKDDASAIRIANSVIDKHPPVKRFGAKRR